MRGRLLLGVSCRAGRGLIPAGAGQTLGGHVNVLEVEGLIPAGAGQTDTPATFRSTFGAHPRGCGADRSLACLNCKSTGLIPAGAGQTPCSIFAPTYHSAHPRGCGADPKGSISIPTDLGSSPRVRGRPLTTSNVALVEGYLETTTLSRSDCTPRARGAIKPPFYYGSSLLCRVRSRIILHATIPSVVKLLSSKKETLGHFNPLLLFLTPIQPEFI